MTLLRKHELKPEHGRVVWK